MKIIILILIIVHVSFAGYTNNGDGTISNDITGLTWQDNSDSNNNKQSWISAINYCENLSLSNNNNWRLPTINELVSLIDHSQYNPAINTLFNNTADTSYWSSTSWVSSKSSAWNVNFFEGTSSINSKSTTCYIRCVSH